jgi:hypothetical protein
VGGGGGGVGAGRVLRWGGLTQICGQCRDDHFFRFISSWMGGVREASICIEEGGGWSQDKGHGGEAGSTDRSDRPGFQPYP